MTEEVKISLKYLYIILLLIDYFQIYSLILFNITYTQYTNTYPQQVHSFISGIRRSLILHPYHNIKYSTTICIILFSLLVFQLLFIFICGIIFKSNSKCRCIRNTSYFILYCLQLFYMHFLTIPIFITLMSFYQCKDGIMLNYPTQSCKSNKYFEDVIFGSLCFILYAIVLWLNECFLKCKNPNSYKPFANPQNDYKYPIYTLKLLLSFFFIYSPHQNTIKVILVLLCSIIVFIYRLFYTNYYNQIIRFILITFDSGTIISSIINFLINFNLITMTKQIYVLSIITSFCFGCLVYVSILSSIEKDLYNKNYNIDKTQENKKIAILLWLLNKASNYNKNEQAKNSYLSFLEIHRLECNNTLTTCKCQTFIQKLILPKTEVVALKLKETAEATASNNQYGRKVMFDGKVISNKASQMNMMTFINEESSNDEDVSNDSESLLNITNHHNASSINESSTFDNENMKPVSMINTLVLDADLNENDCVFNFLKNTIELYIRNTETTKQVNFIILLSYIVKTYLHNYFKALFEMMKLKKKNLSFTDDFIVYTITKDIEYELYLEYKAKTKTEIDIENVLDYTSITNQIVDNMKQIAVNMKHFWSIVSCVKLHKRKYHQHYTQNNNILLNSNYLGKSISSSINNKTLDLYSCALNLTRKIIQLRKLYYILIQNKNYTNQQTIYMYSVFLIKVLNDYETAKKVCEQLQERYRERNDLLEKMAHKNDELYGLFRSMDQVGISIISGNISNIGKILTINHQLCSMLGYDKDELSLETVNKICPSYIAQFHDEFIYRYLETAKKHIIDKVRIVFSLSKENLLIPTFIFVKVIPNLKNSVCFIGLLKKLKKDHPFLNIDTHEKNKDYEIESDKVSFMISNAKGEVFGITKNTMKNFGIPLNCLNTLINNDKVDNIITIDKLFPNINFYEEETVNKLTSDEGMLMVLDSRGIKHLFMDFKESLMNDTSMNNRLFNVIAQMSVNMNNIFKEHYVLCFTYDLLFNEGKVPAKIWKIVQVKKIKNVECGSDTAREINQKLKSSNDVVGLNKSSDIRYSTIIYSNNVSISGNEINKNNFSIEGDNTNVNYKYKKYFALVKRKLTLRSIPFSIKMFIIAICLFLLLLFAFNLTDYVINLDLIDKLNNYLTFYFQFHRRNNLYSLVLLMFRHLILIDSNILITNGNDSNSNTLLLLLSRNDLVKKIESDINEIIDLSYNMSSFYNEFGNKLPTMVLNNDNYDNNNNIDYSSFTFSVNLNSDFTISKKSESYDYIFNSVLVKIQHLIQNYETIPINNKYDLFYNNNITNNLRSTSASEIIKYIFYIIENSNGIVRYVTEMNIFFLNKIILNYSTYLNFNVRIYLCIPVFVLVIGGFFLFYFIFKSVASYKISILRVFYLIDRKFGINCIKNCDSFLQDMDTTVSGNLLGDDNHNNNIHSKHNNLISGHMGTDSNAQLLTDKNVTSSDNTTTDRGTNTYLISEEKDVSEPRWIAFWIYDKMDEKLTQSILEKKNYISSELLRSKKKFWKKICLIYINMTITLILISIYFGITIWLDVRYEKDAMNKREEMSYLILRGWSFINLLIFYRELIFHSCNQSNINHLDYSNSTLLSGFYYENVTAFDLYSLYLNQTDSIENYILLLSGNKDNNSSRNVLYPFIHMEHELNSDKYCSVINETSNTLCDNFYQQNSGIKDNIKIIYLFLKNNFPITYNQSIDKHIELLNRNISFVYFTEKYISKAILLQMKAYGEGLKYYNYNFKDECFIRLMVFIVFEVVEVLIWLWVICYLVKNVNKDKLIFTLLPLESMTLNPILIKTIKELQ